MSGYTPKFREAEASFGHPLPDGLRELIDRFEAATQELDRADQATRERLLPILAGTDAAISAAIRRLQEGEGGSIQPDKLKLLQLKAKALRLKAAD